MRDEEANQRRLENSQRATKRRVQLRESYRTAKREARDVVAMTGICTSWRNTLCAQSSDEIDLLLWKPLFGRLFPDADYQSVQNIDKIHYYSLFQLMANTLHIQTTKNDSERKDLLKNANLRDAIFVIKFEHCGAYSKSNYTSIGTLSPDHIVRLHLPDFFKLVEYKRTKWLKRASPIGFCPTDSPSYDDSFDCNSVDSDLLERAYFPIAEIFVALPCEKNGPCLPFRIYRGSPAWRSFRVESLEYGPELYEDDTIAHLKGRFSLVLQAHHVVFAYGDPAGCYSDEQLDWARKNNSGYDLAIETSLRSNDITSFITGA